MGNEDGIVHSMVTMLLHAHVVLCGVVRCRIRRGRYDGEGGRGGDAVKL